MTVTLAACCRWRHGGPAPTATAGLPEAAATAAAPDPASPVPTAASAAGAGTRETAARTHQGERS